MLRAGEPVEPLAGLPRVSPTERTGHRSGITYLESTLSRNLMT